MQQIIVSMISFIASAIGGLITLLSPFILLLPIPIVAFSHHYLYLLLDRFYPDLDVAEKGRIKGYFSGIASWWHGFFALVVVIMAMLVSDSVLSIIPVISSSFTYGIFPLQNVDVLAGSRIDMWVKMALMILGQPIYSPFLHLVIWVIAAAYMYQFEFTFREHLIASAAERNGDR